MKTKKSDKYACKILLRVMEEEDELQRKAFPFFVIGTVLAIIIPCVACCVCR